MSESCVNCIEGSHHPGQISSIPLSTIHKCRALQGKPDCMYSRVTLKRIAGDCLKLSVLKEFVFSTLVYTEIASRLSIQ